MKRGKAPRLTPRELSCPECGQLPTVSKTRLTVANILTVLPIELLVHTIVVGSNLPYLVKILVLAVTATAVVIWVAEPSARKLLRTWLHAPTLSRRLRADASPALWRARTVLADEAGALERVTHGLARLKANILSIHVHPVSGGVLDEFVLSAPGDLTDDDLLSVLEASGGREIRVWPTTAVALIDGQTRALSFAARVASNPRELAAVVSELLSAEIITNSHLRSSAPTRQKIGTLLKIPTTWHGPLLFSRPGEPFTPAESARAHRLAELAEVIELSGLARDSGRS